MTADPNAAALSAAGSEQGTWRVSRQGEPDETYASGFLARARERVLITAGVKAVAWFDRESDGPWIGETA